MSLESVIEGRGMTFLKKGMRVQSIHSGQFGTIVRGNRQMNLDIKMDGDKHCGNYHPQWMMRYFDENNNVLAEYHD